MSSVTVTFYFILALGYRTFLKQRKGMAFSSAMRGMSAKGWSQGPSGACWFLSPAGLWSAASAVWEKPKRMKVIWGFVCLLAGMPRTDTRHQADNGQIWSNIHRPRLKWLIDWKCDYSISGVCRWESTFIWLEASCFLHKTCTYDRR